MLRRLLLPLLSLCLGVTRCGGDSGVVGPVTNRCARNADCAEGVCDLAQQRCVATARPEVFFALAPAASTASVARFPTLTASRTLRSGDTLDLRFRGARTVYGTVRAPGAEGTPRRGGAGDGGVRARGHRGPGLAHSRGGGRGRQRRAGRRVRRAQLVRHPRRRDLRRGGAPELGVLRAPLRRASSAPSTCAATPSCSASTSRTRAPSPAGRAWCATASATPCPGSRCARWTPTATARCSPPSPTPTATPPTGSSAGTSHIDLAPGAPDTWALRVSSDASRGAWLNVEIPAGARAAMDPRDMRLELSSLAGLPADAAAAPANGAPCNDCVEVLASVEGRGGRERGPSAARRRR